MTDREILLSKIQSYVGTPYDWGGQNHGGIDCSGFVQNCLMSIGLLPYDADREDKTAHGIFHLYKKKNLVTISCPEGRYGDGLGCVAFWWKPDRSRIRHCELVVGKYPELISVGARGARGVPGHVRYRPVFKYREDWILAGFADPWNWPKEGI